MINLTAIKSLATVILGLPPSSRHRADTSIILPSVQPCQLSTSGITGCYGEMVRSGPVDDSIFLRPGDVLLRRVNPDGATVFSDETAHVLPSANILVIRPTGNVESEWFAFVLSATPFLSKLQKRSGIGTTVSALTPHDLSQAAIPVPEEPLRRALIGAWRASLRVSEGLRILLEEQETLRASLGKAAMRGDAAFSRVDITRTECGQKAASPLQPKK